MTEPPSCTCFRCQAWCLNTPGWFMPDEAEALAERMGLALEELFHQSLAVGEGRTPEGKRVLGLSPGITNMPPGAQIGSAHGACRFFRDGRCAIHNLGKPYECRMLAHAEDPAAVMRRHAQVLAAWDDPDHQLMFRASEAADVPA